MIRRPLFDKYATIVSGIRENIAVYCTDISESETVGDLTLKLPDVEIEWLKTQFIIGASNLFELKFSVNGLVKIHDISIAFNIKVEEDNITVICQESEYDETDGTELSDNAEQQYVKTKELLTEHPRIGLVEFCELLERLNALQVQVLITLKLYLDKTYVKKELEQSIENSAKITISCFLFPESLHRILQDVSLPEFEQVFFQEGKKAVIAVFGMEGLMLGDSLCVCGKSTEDELSQCFDVFNDVKATSIEERLRFRSNICNWQINSIKLMPDSFQVTGTRLDEKAVTLQTDIQRLQCLLAILCMATRVTEKNGVYQAEFKGYKVATYTFSRLQLEETAQENIERTLELYRWAYESCMYDKIEIMRNIITISAGDTHALLNHSEEIITSARSSYQFYLTRNVEEFFETRRKIRESIEKFASETAAEVVRLAKEINENVYKTMGLIAAAMVAIIVKPEDIYIIGIIGAGIIALFICGIIFYYMPTIQSTYNIRESQYQDYIESFSKSLDPTEVKSLKENPTITECKELLDKKIRTARYVYIAILIATLISITVFAILTANTPSSNTPGNAVSTVELPNLINASLL